MSPSSTGRRVALATLTLVVWLTVSAAVAVAKVGPNGPEGAAPTETRTVVVSTVDWNQLAIAAAAACAIGVAATLAVLLIVRHGRHASAAHA
jgi:hypothetical protein